MILFACAAGEGSGDLHIHAVLPGPSPLVTQSMEIVLIICAASKGSGEPAHSCILIRALAVQAHIDGN